MEDLYAAFLPQFTELARTRLEKAIAATRLRDHEALATTVRELHAMAGEAGLIGLVEIVQLARKSEETAKRMRNTRTTDDAEALVSLLEELQGVVEHVGERTAPETKPEDGGGTA